MQNYIIIESFYKTVFFGLEKSYEITGNFSANKKGVN